MTHHLGVVDSNPSRQCAERDCSSQAEDGAYCFTHFEQTFALFDEGVMLSLSPAAGRNGGV